MAGKKDAEVKDKEKGKTKEKKEEKKKEKEKKPPTRLERLGGIVKSVNDKFGVNTLMVGYKNFYVGTRVSTGSILMDLATGGGIPIGRVVQFHGKESSGKTSNAIRVAGNLQKLCTKCYTPINGIIDPVTLKPISEVCKCGVQRRGMVVFVDVEGTFDPDWAECLGLLIDPEFFIYCRPESGEESIDIVEALIRSGDIDMIIYDSIAAFAPLEEMKKSAEENTVGLGARLLNRAWRVWGSAMSDAANKNGVAPTVITINQQRLKIGVMYGSPITRPGGEGQKFANSIEIDMKRATEDKTKDEDGNFLPLVTFAGKVTKNKTARPFLEYEFQVATEAFQYKNIRYNKGDIAELKTLRDLAYRYGIMGKDESSKKYFYKKHKFDRQMDLFDKVLYTNAGIIALKQDILEVMRHGKVSA